MERAPRAATEPFTRFPLRVQKHLQQLARQRSLTVGALFLKAFPTHHACYQFYLSAMGPTTAKLLHCTYTLAHHIHIHWQHVKTPSSRRAGPPLLPAPPLGPPAAQAILLQAVTRGKAVRKAAVGRQEFVNTLHLGSRRGATACGSVGCSGRRGEEEVDEVGR